MPSLEMDSIARAEVVAALVGGAAVWKTLSKILTFNTAQHAHSSRSRYCRDRGTRSLRGADYWPIDGGTVAGPSVSLFQSAPITTVVYAWSYACSVDHQQVAAHETRFGFHSSSFHPLAAPKHPLPLQATAIIPAFIENHQVQCRYYWTSLVPRIA